jgi:hypothetical protein
MGTVCPLATLTVANIAKAINALFTFASHQWVLCYQQGSKAEEIASRALEAKSRLPTTATMKKT